MAFQTFNLRHPPENDPSIALRRTRQNCYRYLLLLVAFLVFSTSSVASAAAAKAHNFYRLQAGIAVNEANANGLNTIMESFRKAVMADFDGIMISGIASSGKCACRAGAFAHFIHTSNMPDVEVLGYAVFSIDYDKLSYPEVLLYNFTWHVAPVVRIKSNPSLVWVADPLIGYRSITNWAKFYVRANKRGIQYSTIGLDETLHEPIPANNVTSTVQMYQKFRQMSGEDIPPLINETVAREYELTMRVRGMVLDGDYDINNPPGFVRSEAEAQEILEDGYPRLALMKEQGAFPPESAVCSNGCGTCITM